MVMEESLVVDNPNHAAWKDICSDISATMAKMAAVKLGAGSDGNPLPPVIQIITINPNFGQN